jgi:poly(A) polymerase
MEKALAIQRQVIEILGTDEVYLVGGSVRDIVMGNEPKDYDFTTPMLPDDIEERVKAAGRHPYGIGKKFGTIGFKVPVPRKGSSEDDFMYASTLPYEYVEVTTFRSEVYTSKSRKPEVAFVTSLDEDLARRDFTMNAMVLRPNGTIYDPYGGKLDIHAKQIVTVGLPKDRIQEDPLRMLRAARFAARYGFAIDPNFIGKARQLADRIYDVSVERWVMELDKLLTSDQAHFGIGNLIKMGLFKRIIPELYVQEETVIFPQDYGQDADSAWRTLLLHTGERLLPEHDAKLSRYINTGICARLKFSSTRTSKIVDKPINEHVQ